MIADSETHDNNQSNDYADRKTSNDMETFVKLLYKIWGITEVLKSDVNYIMEIYTAPTHKKNKRVNKSERIAKIKHRLIASGKKFTKLHNLNE
ncbi:hypothetical protein DU508_17575 [Pedobacter chinensis]|uniref:Uncharacterized protein n=1 Tax=Pedobacter chinensis TaxID=2282421 RepID=A0A369PS70_9SPHI|nr:hypothetical protein [Pedobacter chinensis]RDC55383.1 hypothetical protein DU508_17575 [Pedobacter chinensis]